MLSVLFNFARTSCPANTSFFGLKPWWAYLPDDHFQTINGSCEIRNFNLPRGGGGTNDVVLVLLAVVDDLLRIAGIVAVGFVLYGAIKLIASQGEPEARANARTTILNALIGVAITTIAVVLVSFLGTAIG